MNIEQLKEQAEIIEQDRMPCLQVQATLALAEQVKRIADLFEDLITISTDGTVTLDVFADRFTTKDVK